MYSNINNITRPRNLLHDVDGGIGSSAGGSGGFGSKGNDGSSGDGRKITLLTGANGSGKSIYLKQVVINAGLFIISIEINSNQTLLESIQIKHYSNQKFLLTEH